MKYLIVVCLLAIFFSCNNTDSNDTDPDLPSVTGIAAPVKLSFNIISQFPHDTGAYTQGLELYKGKMYESTGDFTNSSLRVTDYKTGKVEKIHPMGTDKIFGEGITILDNKIYQLTWQSNIVYVYDVADISKPIKTFNWPYEGWGVTNNGTELIISDGSSNLYFVDPASFKVRTMISVKTNQGPVDNLNELEFVEGFIYANVYGELSIVKINPETGYVTGILQFPDLPTNEKNGRTAEFNGIAYDSTSKSFYVTGKRWPKMYEIKLN